MAEDDDHRCDPGYEQCVEFSRTIRSQHQKIERLTAVLTSIRSALDEVDDTPFGKVDKLLNKMATFADAELLRADD